jgi:hypothetical protein
VRLVAASTQSAPSGRRVSKSSYRRVHADQRPPRRGSARWPTARFDRATRPAARRHSSVPLPPPHARPRGSSGVPALPGSGGTITTAASPMLHELALPARSRSAAYQLGHNAARTISASHLWHPFAGVVDVPPLCAVGGGAGGVGDSSKRNRRQASHFPECGEVNG